MSRKRWSVIRKAAALRIGGRRFKSFIVRAKYWEIIADNFSKEGWSWGCVSAIDSNGRTIWIADAHRDEGKHYVLRADEKLTAFLELELAIRLASAKSG